MRRAPDRGALASSILRAQAPSGMICWFPGGHADPWNHVEAAMALAVSGRRAAATAAYRFLLASQRADGSWPAYTAADGSVEEARADTNACCYLATGLWHQHLVTGDAQLLEEAFPAMEAALDFALGHRRAGGLLSWSVEGEAGAPASLLAASCSVVRSLEAALRVAALLGARRDEWAAARAALAAAVRAPAGRFLDKGEFAMDWYYPVLSGALSAAEGRRLLAARWGEFVVPGAGVRCRTDRRWVTTAESAELALALVSVGRRRRAARLLALLADKEAPGGGYLTGLVYPERASFPEGEVSSYSAAAALLAADALAGGATAALFAPMRRSTRSEPQEDSSSAAYSPLASASR